ncbi:MAG TPA: serine/threonine-protein kinase [Streptosporangiaceae bacterium]|jgi:serine/threonine-protein kinase|nr:serine/threonine-protein kinase [Streptosporangiaceae bacterium]
MSQEELVLSNRYRLERRLATGGMGEVWEATDELLIRPVAVKLLRREYISDEAARSRFRAEARFAAALQHGGIAQVYDYGEQDDLAYLVMELVPGEPLSKILIRNKVLSTEATLDLVSQAARALQVAHGAGIIHRDIKPGNLMVTGDGTVKITDFGIARNGQASELTQVGMVMGTAHYVSPEQASGKDITPATDLYSLGVVAYECLAGRPPFDADSAVAIALKHVRETPPELPPEVPAPVRELVRQLLSKDPASRPDGAQEVADRAYMIRESLQLGTAIAEFEEQLARPEAETGQFHGGAETLAGIAVPGAGGSGGSGDAPGPNTNANASAGTDESGPHRRNVLLLTSVAVGLLVLGLIVMGSLLRDGQPGNLGDGNGEQPASPPTAVGNDQARQPTGGRTQTAEPSRPAVPVSAGTVESPTPTATPSTPTSKPTGSRSPKPTPSATVTITPEPSPEPSESGGQKLGSDS